MRDHQCQRWRESIAAVSEVMPEECEGCPLIALTSSGAGGVICHPTRQGLTAGVHSESPDAALSPKGARDVPRPEPEHYGRINEAARSLSVSSSYIYKHKEDLPFMVLLPGGTWRVSMRRLREYMDDGTSSNQGARRARSIRRAKRDD